MAICRAKFTVSKVSVFGSVYQSGGEIKDYKEITMQPVCGGSEENRSFASATPNGTLTFTLTNPDLQDEFKPGTSYYLDFTRADEEK